MLVFVSGVLWLKNKTFCDFRQRIKDALNAQTYEQFLQYAQQQYPGNFDQQAVLIRQLQDKHYQQYILQLAVDQRLANSNIKDTTEDKANDNNTNSEVVKEETAPVSDYNLNETEITIVDKKWVFKILP